MLSPKFETCPPSRSASWFFHTVGSGVFIDCEAMRARGRILAYRDRREWWDSPALNRERRMLAGGMLGGRMLGGRRLGGRRLGGRVLGGRRLGDETIAAWMHDNDVAMLIFTQEDFRAYKMGNGLNPRTEIVVRHATRWGREFSAPHSACLDHPSIAIPLRTGFAGSLPCVCEEHARVSASWHTRLVNCDGTRRPTPPPPVPHMPPPRLPPPARPP